MSDSVAGSAGKPSLFVYLSYRDPVAAIVWLGAIGFSVVTRQDDANGGVTHAELRRGTAVLMLGGADADYVPPPLLGQSVGQGTYLLVDDVAAVHAAALAAGATEVFPPESTEWGSSRSRVLDAEGHEWSFGTYEPGNAW